VKLNKLKPTYIFIGVITSLVIFGFSIIDNSSKKHNAVTLGKLLFSEKILSKDSSVSCSSCHKPAFAFADTTAFSIGINNQLTRRNTPSVLNMKNRPYYFYDGRANSLAEQALMPIQNPDEMGLPIDIAIERLNQSVFYKNYFRKVFRSLPNKKNLAEAFAAYEKTLETIDSKFDDWSNNLTNLSASEERGREIFIGEKAKCFNCHFLEDFTNDDFKNIGLYNSTSLNDSGRAVITNKKSDLGKFKTPGLRNIAVTAPYMHNGMFNTLEEVVDYYNDTKKFVSNSINIDTALEKPLGLTELEKKDLVAFLKTLTDKAFYKNSQ
jgi:cytochrome c peroxidase